MAHFLYPEFLSIDAEYRAAEKYWESLIHATAASLGQEGDWSPWIPRTTPNGTPVERDGNPIVDGRSNSIGRAFRIIQHAPTSDGVEMSAWVKVYEEEFVDLPHDELVINLSLSEESATVAARLLRRWMTPGVTPKEMERVIAQELPRSPSRSTGRSGKRSGRGKRRPRT